MFEEEKASALAVRFYQREVEMGYESEQAGRPVYKMQDYVRIEIPGNSTSIIDTFANESHKQRFPMEWARYQNEKVDGEISGTLLRDWPLLNAAQAAELKHFKFYTVEQVANASDAQIASVGMLVGMAPHSFREKAKAYIAHAKDSAVVQAQGDELRKRDQEIADLRAEIERLARLQESKPRGRPPKELQEAA